MNYRLRFDLLAVLTTFFLSLSFTLQSQTPSVKAVSYEIPRSAELASQFNAYSTYRIPSAQLVEIVRAENFDHRVDLEIPGFGTFALQLFENPLQAANYQLTTRDENGINRQPGIGIVKTFTGTLEGGKSLISLTIDHGFIYGAIQLPNRDLLRIEPLRMYVKPAGQDDFIVFKTSDLVQRKENACEMRLHMQEAHQEEPGIEEEDRTQLVCRTIQIALADDWLMYQDYNQDVQDVENHNMGVINDVSTNYDTEFDDDLMFEVVEIWISTCSTCDPWTNSTDPGALLDDFTDWGPNGFDNTHDVADLWTDRDFNGGTIGISWVGGVCTPFKYLTTQDFSTGGGQLRTLMAHELGHNFGATHDPDGSNTIMAPILVVTNTWSNQSLNQINNYIDDINCLSVCQSVQPPEADFSADEVVGCDPFIVHFNDESTGPPTSWEWTFPGGTPSSSTQQNPTVTYNTPGIYDVVLEVSNSAGTSTLVRSDYITVLEEPVADFDFIQNELTLLFTSLSDGADSWFWQFGDGETSNQENPSHTYDIDGVYEVTLSVSNECGEDEYSLEIEVYVPPMADFSYSVDVGCAPLSVQFINESSDNVQSFEWLFPGGTPSSSTQENPVVVYNNPGFYDVTLIVENIAGVDELHINNLIEVQPLPEADFDFSINGLHVQFANASVYADTYLWNFGDGETSIAPNPLHIYDNGGTYTVTLEATNDCGTDIYTATVVLNSEPIADFIGDPTTGCAPLTVEFTSTSLGVVTSYNWSFPGGSPSSSNQPMPTVVYNSPGSFDVRLIVGNAIGFDTLLLEDFIVVTNDVTSNFTVNVDGSTVDLLNTSSGATEFLWLIDGNTFTSEDLTYTFDDDGDYLIQLIASGECGSDTSSQVIHISTEPIAGFASNVVSGCQPLTVEFVNTSSSNVTTFAWVFEGGTPSTSSEENPVVVYNQPGIYDVQLTVWSAGGMDVLLITEMIEVSPQPVASFTTVQTGLDLEFINNSQYADEFYWEFGDGNFSTEMNPTHTYADFGTYTIELVVENSCGTDTLSVQLQLSGAPVPVFTANQTHGCVPMEVQFIDMSQNNPEFWEWSFPGGTPDTSNLQNPVIVYTEPGIYPVTLRVSNAGGAQSMVSDAFIHVATPPTAEFAPVPDDEIVSFINQSQDATIYIWQFGDGGMDTATNPVHVYSVSGTYEVMLIAMNACASDTVTQQITVTVTGVEDIGEGIFVNVFPNPNIGDFTVTLDNAKESYEMEVFDVIGRSVLQSTLEPSSSGKHTFSLDPGAEGLYTLVIRRKDFQYVVKMVVL